ncbi:MAG: LD-carboxypeptidase [Rickettsiaceae bacterium]|nr:LD-carboxypeptidase [Rickettsiaceae bacterium]
MKTSITVIAPSSGCIDCKSKLEAAIKILKEKSFDSFFHSKELFADLPLPYYANTREKRLDGLREAISDRAHHNDFDKEIIWAFRGGYGSGELVFDCMDLTNQKSFAKKLLIGFSDITAIHLLFNQSFNIPSLHAANLTTLNQTNADWIRTVINGEKYSITLLPLNMNAEIFIKNDELLSGKIIGGNLAVLQTMIGTKLHPETAGKILFIEDCNEPGYKIARMLNHLEQAGLLDNVKSILLGEFTGGDEHKNYAINEFVSRHVNVPIFSIPCGHGEVNHPLLLGGDVKIHTNILEFRYILSI